jgi:hypothetical protein
LLRHAVVTYSPLLPQVLLLACLATGCQAADNGHRSDVQACESQVAHKGRMELCSKVSKKEQQEACTKNAQRALDRALARSTNPTKPSSMESEPAYEDEAEASTAYHNNRGLTNPKQSWDCGTGCALRARTYLDELYVNIFSTSGGTSSEWPCSWVAEHACCRHRAFC